MANHDPPPTDTQVQELVAILEQMGSSRQPETARTRAVPLEAPQTREQQRTEAEGTSSSAPVSLAQPPVWDEDALRAVLESVPDAVIAADSRGTIVLVNRQTEELFGYDRSDVLGRPVEILMPERFRAAHVAQRNGYFTDPRIRPMGANLELWGRRKDGREFPVEISLSPLPTPAGLLVTTTVRDISLRRQA